MSVELLFGTIILVVDQSQALSFVHLGLSLCLQRCKTAVLVRLAPGREQTHSNLFQDHLARAKDEGHRRCMCWNDVSISEGSWILIGQSEER